MKFTQHLSFFIRSFFLQTGWNYSHYQSLGLFFVMWPFLKKLYRQDPDAIPSVVSRYLAMFNTQPVLASFCFGALAKQEEFIAHATGFNQTNEEDYHNYWTCVMCCDRKGTMDFANLRRVRLRTHFGQ